MLKEAVPKLARVAFSIIRVVRLYTRGKEDLSDRGGRAGVSIQHWEVRAAALETAFATQKKKRPDGIYVPPGGRNAC